MTRTAIVMMGVLAVASAAMGQAPESGDAAISQFLSIRTPSQVTLASDGRVYFRDWPSGLNQLYRREPDEPVTSQGKQLTFFPDGITRRQEFKVSPNGRWVAVPVDKGGNEQHDIYLLDTQTDALTPALVDPDIVFNVQVWLKDSSGFIYTSNELSPTDFYILWYDIHDKVSVQLFPGQGMWFVSDVSRDTKRFIATQYLSISNSRVIEQNSGIAEFVDYSATTRGMPSQNLGVGYMRGEQQMLMISDISTTGIRQLYRVVLDRKDPDYSMFFPLAPQFEQVPLDDAVISDDRSLLAMTLNEGGYSELELFSLPDLAPLPAPEIERGVVRLSGIVGRTLVYTLSNAHTPGLAYGYDIPEHEGDAPRAPRALSARMDKQDVDLSEFQLPELVSYEAFDRLSIPAFLYLPKGAEPGKPIPFVVSFHGGPEGQARPSFNPTIAYLVSHGYGVMVPNVRGSTGYGRAYHELDNYKKRWDAVKDGADAARWLVAKGYARPGEIAAYGGSYGGFMAVASVIEGADVFGAAVDVVGIVNFATFLQYTKGYRRKLREQEYGPLTDLAFLNKISPLERMDEIHVPVMIAHGLNDPRVPVQEAMQLATALQKNGRDPELLFFPDEGHGFAKLDNRILFGERLVRFLDRTIGPGTK